MPFTHCSPVALPPVLKEGEFFRAEPSSREDVSSMWQQERQHMQNTLRRQKEQMREDKKWLEKEERLLVGNGASLTSVAPLSASLCPPTRLNVALEATWSRPSSNNINPLVHARRPVSFELNVPLMSFPKGGSMSILCRMNLPVLLQDPTGPEVAAGPAVSVRQRKIGLESHCGQMLFGNAPHISEPSLFHLAKYSYSHP